VARAALADIISYIRTRVDDTGAAPRYSDDQIQTLLDSYRVFHHEVDLATAANYKIHWGPTFAEDAVITDELGDEVETTSDPMSGTWETETEYSELSITCWEHDPMNVVADLLEMKLTQMGDRFIRVSTGRHTIDRTKGAGGLIAAIKAARGAAKFTPPGKPTVVRFYRTDFRS
jgi:hypothetical protein